MARAPIPTPEVLWRKPPVLALAAVPGAATAAAGQWDPGQTSSDARKAAQDDSSIAVLGEFNSGAIAISIPIPTRPAPAGLAVNTYVGLTRSEGAEKGEPDKYYPSGKRTYGRVVPADHIQAAAQVTYQKALRAARRPYILNDKEVYGKGVADPVENGSPRRQASRSPQRRHRHQGGELPLAGRQDQGSGADCMFFGGITARTRASQVFNDVNAANPDVKLFGPDGVAETTFTYEALSPRPQKQSLHHGPTLDPKLYPPEGQDVLRGLQGQVRQGARARTRSTATRR